MDQVLDKKLLFVSGKGGTGKSFVAATLALLATYQGKRVLLMEYSSHGGLGALFGHPDKVGHKAVQVTPLLSCINFDARQCFREYVVKHLGMATLYEKVFTHATVQSFLSALPALAETMVLGRIFHDCELVQDNKYDLMIFDGPASGHFLNFLTTPEAIIQAGLGGPLVKEVERIKNFLQEEKRCSALVVTQPAELIVGETLEFLPKYAALSPIKDFSLIINRSLGSEYEQQESLFAMLSQQPGLQHTLSFLQKKWSDSKHWENYLLDQLEPSFLPAQKIMRFPEWGVIEEPLQSFLPVDHPFMRGMLHGT